MRKLWLTTAAVLTALLCIGGPASAAEPLQPVPILPGFPDLPKLELPLPLDLPVPTIPPKGPPEPVVQERGTLRIDPEKVIGRAPRGFEFINPIIRAVRGEAPLLGSVGVLEAGYSAYSSRIVTSIPWHLRLWDGDRCGYNGGTMWVDNSNSLYVDGIVGSLWCQGGPANYNTATSMVTFRWNGFTWESWNLWCTVHSGYHTANGDYRVYQCANPGPGHAMTFGQYMSMYWPANQHWYGTAWFGYT